MVQPLLYWLEASPEGLITDESDAPILGLIEIKCPFSKSNLHPQDKLKDKNFYVELRDGMLHLKEEHSWFLEWLLFSDPDGNGSISVEVLRFYCVKF